MNEFRYAIFILSILPIMGVLHSGCNKQDEWLDKKSNKTDIIPTKISDYQALLDNDLLMCSNYPNLGLVSCDNYYVTSDSWNATSDREIRNSYIWNPDIYEGNFSESWNLPYMAIAHCNAVLEGVEKIGRTSGNDLEWRKAMGNALFYRAFSFYNLAQHFAKPYNLETATKDMGIPIRLSADVNEKSVRTSVKQTYEQIINDLQFAIELLPENVSFKTHPTKYAAHALLAKTYLNMADYEKAYFHADKVLERQSDLLNYNTLTTGGTRSPFPNFQQNNPEVIFFATTNTDAYFRYPVLIVDSTLYTSYAVDDLRREALFRPGTSSDVFSFKGTYSGTTAPFAGLAVNETMLIRAEANARLGNSDAAMADLNSLLRTRWRTDKFEDMTAATPDDALDKVLMERRKELPFTGSIRWEDQRRLNLNPRYAKTVTRHINGQIYTLEPNSIYYVLPIPNNEILLSRIEQNPR